jgi:hypothetical protein
VLHSLRKVNPARFKAPILSKADIESEAQRIRGKYPSIQKIPVDVLGFAEFDLDLEFDYAPIQQFKLDAILRPDLAGIVFDPWVFREPSLHQRLRFSAAHELAHFFLHKDVYGKLEFTTVKQWIAFVRAIPAKEYNWIEWHADEFAGKFLIPSQHLSPALNEAVNDAEREGIFAQGPEEVLEFCCRAIHGDFGVSFSAMQTRIRKSSLWPHSKLAPVQN